MLFKLAFQNIRRSKGFFLSYILTIATFLVIVYGISIMEGALITKTFADLQLKDLNISLVFSVLKSTIYVIIILFTIYTSRFFIQRRGKEVALLKTLGLNRQKIWYMLVIENTIVLLIASIIGVFVGILFSRFIIMLGANMIGFTLSNVNFIASSSALFDMLVIVGLIFVTINLIPIRSILKVSIVALFQESKKQDKPVKRPFISMILFFVCFGFLVYLLVSKSASLAVLNLQLIGLLFFTAVLVVIFFYRGFLMYYFNHYKSNNKGIGSPSKQLSFNHLSGSIQSVYKMMTLITILTAILSVFIVSIFGILNSTISSFNTSSTNFFSAISNQDATTREVEQAISSINEAPTITIPIYYNETGGYIKHSDFIHLMNTLFKNNKELNAYQKLNLNQGFSLSPYSNVKSFIQMYPDTVVSRLEEELLQSPFINIVQTDVFDFKENEFPRSFVTNTFKGFLLTLNDEHPVFKDNTLKQVMYTSSTAEVTKINLLDFYQLALSDLFNGSNQSSLAMTGTFFVLIGFTAIVGLFQIMLFAFMIVVVTALMMSMFFRSLENLERGATEYEIAKRLGMSQTIVRIGLIIETFVTQLLPFYIGMIGSLWMYSFLFKDLNDTNISFGTAMTEPATLFIFVFVITITHVLAFILVMIAQNQINTSQYVNQD